MYHWYAADLWQVLDNLTEAFSGDALTQARQTFLEGYQQIQSLPANWEEILPWMKRFVHLYGYSRLIRCVAEVPQDQPEWMVALRADLIKDLADMEAGMLH